MRIKKIIVILLTLIITITSMPINLVLAEPNIQSNESEHSENIDDLELQDNQEDALLPDEKITPTEDNTIQEDEQVLKEDTVEPVQEENTLNIPIPYGSENDAWNIQYSNSNSVNGDTTTYKAVINFSRDPSNSNNLEKEYEIYIRADYFSDKNSINLTVPTVTLKNGTQAPTFKIMESPGTFTLDGEIYYRYVVSYNTQLDDPVTGYDQVLTSTYIQVDLDIKTVTITETIKKPVIIKSEEEVIVDGGEIIPPTTDNVLALSKAVNEIYQLQSGGAYKKYEGTIEKPFKVEAGDIVKYIIKLENKSDKKLDNITVYEQLPAGMEFINGSFPLESGGNVTNVNNKWIVASDGKGTHKYNESITLNPGEEKELYFYGKIKGDPATSDKLTNYVNAYIDDDKKHAADETLTDKEVYDLQLITGFVALNGNAPKGVTPSKPENDPYKVMTGDELTLRVKLKNAALKPVKNIVIALYLPEAFTIKDNPSSISQYAAITSPSGCDWTGLTVNKISKDYLSTLGDLLNTGAAGEIEFDIPVVVGDISNISNPSDLYVGAEIVDFEDANDSSLNIRDNTIVDEDSIPDDDPYNDLMVNGVYTEINSGTKEMDNAWGGRSKQIPTHDEDDFDFAYVVKEDNPVDPERFITKKRESAYEAERFLHELTINGNHYGPKLNFDPLLTPLADDGKITGNNNYMLYTFVVNEDSRQVIDDEILITDVLPEGMELLSGINPSMQERYAISYKGTFPGSSIVYHGDTLDNFLTVSADKRTFTLTIPKDDTGGFKHDSKEFTIRFLARINPSSTENGQVYKNSVTMEYGETQIITNEESSAQWGNVSSSSAVKKYVYDKNKGEYIDSSDLNLLNSGDNEIKYRLIFTSNGFVQALAAPITDYLDHPENIETVDVEISGFNGSLTNDYQIGNLIPISEDKLAYNYTIASDNTKVIFNQDKDISAYQVYHLDITVKYKSINSGMLITNALSKDTVKSLKPLSLTLVKENSSGTVLEGSEFTAYYADSSWNVDYSNHVKDIDDKNIKLNPGTNKDTVNFVPEGYETGSQWFIVLPETKTPAGYEENLNREFKVQVDKDSEGNLSYTFVGTNQEGRLNGDILTLINEPDPLLSAKITKSDENGSLISVPVSFDIYKLKEDGTRDILAAAIITNNGKSPSFSLEKGKYELIEKQVPAGFEQTSLAHVFFTVSKEANALKLTLDSNPDNNNVTLSPDENGIFVFSATNIRIKVPVVLMKQDQDGNPLKGAIFTLKSQTGETVESISDIDGKVVFSDLLPGNYTIKETNPPTGYHAIDKTWEVTIHLDGTIQIIDSETNTEIGELIVTNEKIYGGFIFQKQDEYKNPLLGAEFGLTDSKGNQTTAVSDENGSISFEGLEPGRYILEETAPPEGYIKSDITWEVIVDDEGNIQLTETGNSEVITSLVVVNKQLATEKTSHLVEKVWDDNNDQYKARPDNIKVQLKANGHNFGEAVLLSKDNNWSYKWDNLDKYAANQQIKYTVEELEVPKHYTNKTVTEENKTIITNQYQPEKKGTIPWKTQKINNSKSKDVKTGDNTSLRLLWVTMIASGFSAAIIIMKRKRRMK